MRSNAFSSLPSLQELNLSDNELRDVSSEALAGLVNLRELYVHRAGMKTIRASFFSATPNLRKLDLRETELELVEPNAFSGLRGKLRVLLKRTGSTCELLKPFEEESHVEFELSNF